MVAAGGVEECEDSRARGDEQSPATGEEAVTGARGGSHAAEEQERGAGWASPRPTSRGAGTRPGGEAVSTLLVFHPSIGEAEEEERGEAGGLKGMGATPGVKNEPPGGRRREEQQDATAASACCCSVTGCELGSTAGG